MSLFGTFFLTCIKISAIFFSGNFTLLVPVSLKSPSHEPKYKHFYIYSYFVESMKNFPPHTATCCSPLRVKLISAVYAEVSQGLSRVSAGWKTSVKTQSSLVSECSELSLSDVFWEWICLSSVPWTRGSQLGFALCF